MNTEKLSHWIQIISGIALVAGLGLVVFEMQQTKQLLRMQLIAERDDLGLSRTVAFLGENPMGALAKTCDSDEAMTREDALILNNLFLSHTFTAIRQYQVDTLGGFEDELWRGVARSRFLDVFATAHGRAWYVAAVHDVPPSPLIEFGNELLASLGPPNCYPEVQAILDAHAAVN